MRLAFIFLSIGFICYGLGYSVGQSDGTSKAMKSVLKTNPPSQELELVCAGLWIGEQNKKYWEKTK